MIFKITVGDKIIQRRNNNEQTSRNNNEQTFYPARGIYDKWHASSTLDFCLVIFAVFFHIVVIQSRYKRQIGRWVPF